MDASDKAAADGSIGIDHAWKSQLSKLLSETPLPRSLLDAVQSIPQVDQGLLCAVIEGMHEDWDGSWWLSGSAWAKARQ